MSRYQLFILLLSFIYLAQTSCAPKIQEDKVPTNNELANLTPEELKEKAPNDAFEAVYLKETQSVIDLLETHRSLFSKKNKEGMTPLMVALSLKLRETSQEIASTLNLEELQHTDLEGRGYISYAAQYGDIITIDIIAEKYKSSLSSYKFVADFNHFFIEIDFPDNHGRTALFYALNSAVAERLKDHWLHGNIPSLFQKTWFSQFFNTKDLEEQNFLHLAALNNRHDVLEWILSAVCGPSYFNDSDALYGGVKTAGKLWDWYTDWMQNDTFYIPESLVNQQSSTAQTPLHLAVKNGHEQAAMAIMSCKKTDYQKANLFGRNALSELLAHIDPHKEEVGPARKNIFKSLHTRITNTHFWRQPHSYINQQDLDGKSSLHYAAKLKDPYFYNELKKYGNIYLEDHNGSTPDSLFKSRGL